MKTAIILTLCLFTISKIDAQIAGKAIQFNMYFGFNKNADERNYGYYNFDESEESDLISFDYGLNPGFFLSKNILVGLGYYRSIETVSITSTDNNYAFGIRNSKYKSKYSVNNFGLLIRYYTWINPKLAIFAEPSYFYGSGNYIDNIRTERASTSNNSVIFIENEIQYDVLRHSISLTPGIAYLINDWISLELRLGRFAFIREEIDQTDLIIKSNDPLYDPAFFNNTEIKRTDIFGTLQMDSFLLGLNFILNNNRKKEND